MDTARVNRAKRLVACCNPSVLERRQMRGLLHKAGYSCVAFENPQLLIDNLNVAVPRVILFDADELGIGRFDALRQIRDRHPQLAAPVIFLTTSCDRDDVQRARDAGAQDYLVKPVPPKRLLQRLDHWTGVRIPCRPASFYAGA